MKIKKSNLRSKIALANVGPSPAYVELCSFTFGFVSTLSCLRSSASHDPPSSLNNSSAPRYDASYLSELKASTPGSRPITGSRTESYSVDLTMDDDLMLVDDTMGKLDATLLLSSIR